MKLSAGRMAEKLARRKRRMEKRLQAARDGRFVRRMSGAPAVLSTAGLKSELADRTQAIVYGGVPLMLRVARESGLIDAMDSTVPILQWRCPYYESDHVLNLAMNALCEGTCLEHGVSNSERQGAAAQRRGVPQRDRGRLDPRSDHGGGLLPAVQRHQRAVAARRDPPGAAQRVAAAVPRVLRRGADRQGRHADRHHRRVPGGEGHLLQR